MTLETTLNVLHTQLYRAMEDYLGNYADDMLNATVRKPAGDIMVTLIPTETIVACFSNGNKREHINIEEFISTHLPTFDELMSEVIRDHESECDDYKEGVDPAFTSLHDYYSMRY